MLSPNIHRGLMRDVFGRSDADLQHMRAHGLRRRYAIAAQNGLHDAIMFAPG